MPRLPSAIGYLRSDVSGARQQWDENQIRRTAVRFGYDLSKIIVFGGATDQPMKRLRVALDRQNTDAVITPSLRHFEPSEVPEELRAVAAVITVSPEQIFARWDTPAKPTGGLK
ncbi:hypothetical protein OHB26_33510 [Nocardia sp. NBC_01503]|uniref:hypothetical protein n=1 Tax=Nocardia sp. NBC_01503 TaxID=2975997 RepID=UPI002E7B8AED|nr:hypothetical protein [Nocardia sp. NBC_01503]WTL31771.1 hypothetical protein OHB26_33510 [Nocardia sp. NBC_01503]